MVYGESLEYLPYGLDSFAEGLRATIGAMAQEKLFWAAREAFLCGLESEQEPGEPSNHVFGMDFVHVEWCSASMRYLVGYHSASTFLGERFRGYSYLVCSVVGSWYLLRPSVILRLVFPHVAIVFTSSDDVRRIWSAWTFGSLRAGRAGLTTCEGTNPRPSLRPLSARWTSHTLPLFSLAHTVIILFTNKISWTQLSVASATLPSDPSCLSTHS